MFVFDSASSLHEVSAGRYKTETALEAVVIAAMAVAVATGELFTCSCSASGYSEQDVNNVMRELSRANYLAHLSGTTLTITW